MYGIKTKRVHKYIITDEEMALEGNYYCFSRRDLIRFMNTDKEKIFQKFENKVINDEFRFIEEYSNDEEKNRLITVAEDDLLSLHDTLKYEEINNYKDLYMVIDEGNYDRKFDSEYTYVLEVEFGNRTETYNFYESKELYSEVGQNHESNKYIKLLNKSEFIKGITGGSNEFSIRQTDSNWYITTEGEVDGEEYNINWNKDEVLLHLRKEFPKEMELIEKVNDNSMEQIEKPKEINLTVVKETNDLDNIELPDNQNDDDLSWIME